MSRVVSSIGRASRLVALGAGCAAGGYALARVASAFGDRSPLILLGLTLIPVAALAVLVDPRLGVVAVLAMFPIGVVHVPGTPAELVQVVIMIVGVLVLLRRLAAGANPLGWAGPLAWVVALGAWSALSLPSAADRSLALRAVGGLGVQLVLASTVIAACRTPSDVRRVLGVFVLVIAGVGLTAPGAASKAHASLGGSVISGRAAGIFAEPNQMGTFCALGALVAAGLALGARTQRGRWSASAGGALALVGLILSLSRGAWIGFACGVVVLLVGLPEARRALIVLALPVLLLALVIGAFAPSRPQVEVVGARLKSVVGEKSPYDNRPAIWGDARKLVASRPVLGRGPGSYPVVSVRTTSSDRPTFAEHAHDILLTWAVEAGLPAAAAIVGLCVHVAVVGRRARRRARRTGRLGDAALVSGLLAALAAVMGQGLIDFTLRNSVVYSSVFFVLGALLSLVRLVGTGEQAGAIAVPVGASGAQR